MKLKAVMAVVAGAALLACNSPVDPERDLARSVVIISGDNQTVPKGSVPPQKIVIEVQDAQGRPVRTNPVYWTIEHKDHGRIGTVIEALAETDRHGRADARVQLDTIAGEYHVIAWAGRYFNEVTGDSVWVQATAKVFGQ